MRLVEQTAPFLRLVVWHHLDERTGRMVTLVAFPFSAASDVAF
jgi:hypothetical protein